MKQLPDTIKLTYLIAAVLLVTFVVFIVMMVIVYNKRQVFFIQQQRLREVEHQNEMLQKELEKQRSIEKERERISHDMHDDLGAGISAIKLQAEFLKQRVDDQELQDDIDELLKTSEEMNISMREMLWSLNSENDTLGNFIEYAIRYTEHFLKKTTIVLHSDSENIGTRTQISTELRRNLFLCLKEAVNNAYKHSQADTITLSFSLQAAIFTMIISDNGCGIPKNHHEGNGIRNMKRRMSELTGECMMTTESHGTRLIFRIKL
ncbi:sensor histidine kinase [Chryseobacterium pennipullorum]|uniref:histidine kinase n=1 Tax=Chryseobacterium pennipullorum TaxID=2258963 RepID=A0A3D9B6V6_9FLAO|nr:histidine kinase [Chryseobacterium pennipullorum]REC49117.1 two-component sensor histidine kinase [Chryseobacterium pennipullorum]